MNSIGIKILFGLMTFLSFEEIRVTGIYRNFIHGRLFFACADGRFNINTLESYYNGTARDRRFDLGCRGTYGTGRPLCQRWTPFTTELIDYNCPGDYYLSGLQSEWDPDRRDRRWSFWCCKTADEYIVLRDCFTTDFRNDFRFFISYRLTGEYMVIRGIRTSAIDNETRDRRWQFRVCRQSPVALPFEQIKKKD